MCNFGTVNVSDVMVLFGTACVIYFIINFTLSCIVRSMQARRKKALVFAPAKAAESRNSLLPPFSFSESFTQRKPAPGLLQQLPGAGFCTQIRSLVCTRVVFECPSAFFGGRGWITRAAHLKMPRTGFLARRTVRRAAAVRIHPPSESGFVAKQKPQRTFIR